MTTTEALEYIMFFIFNDLQVKSLQFKKVLFSLEYKSRDSYSRLIEFSPKFYYSNLVFV